MTAAETEAEASITEEAETTEEGEMTEGNTTILTMTDHPVEEWSKAGHVEDALQDKIQD